jgi:hypothetical protein
MEFNYDADKKPVILVSLEDFECMAHAAIYSSSDKDYIQRFPIISHKIIEASSRIESTIGFINHFRANKGKSPDVPSQVE